MTGTTGTEYSQPRQAEGRPQPKRSALALAALLLAVASAAVPLSLVKPWVGMGLWAVMLIGCVVLLRAMRVGVTLTLIASVAALALSGTYLFAGTLAAALCVGTFAGAFLMTTLKKPWLACLIPLVSVGVTAIFTRDWLFLLAALSLLPAGALTAFATRRGMGRTSVICYGAAGLLAAALLLCGLAVARTEAGLSVETVRELFDGWKAKMLAERIEMRDELLTMLERLYANSLPTAGTSAEKMLDSYRQLLSDANLEASLTALFNVIPGLAVTIALIAAYLGQLLLLEGCDAAGARGCIKPESEFLVVSLPAAILWTVCLVISLVTESATVASITAENLFLALTPGLCAVGWHTLMRFFRAVPAQGRWILILPAAAVVCCASTSAFYILAAYGAYGTVLSAVRRAMLRRGNPDPPDDGSDDD